MQRTTASVFASDDVRNRLWRLISLFIQPLSHALIDVCIVISEVLASVMESTGNGTVNTVF